MPTNHIPDYRFNGATADVKIYQRPPSGFTVLLTINTLSDAGIIYAGIKELYKELEATYAPAIPASELVLMYMPYHQMFWRIILPSEKAWEYGKAYYQIEPHLHEGVVRAMNHEPFPVVNGFELPDPILGYSKRG